jgi:hypothetical protein
VVVDTSGRTDNDTTNKWGGCTMLRSVVAVVTGFLLIMLLSLGMDTVLRTVLPAAFAADGRVDGVPLLLFMQACVGVFAIAGCWLAARLAPRRPMFHALVLGVLGLAFNIAGSYAMWHTAPAWYHVLAIVLVLPYAWAGGQLREFQLARGGAAEAGFAR